MKKIFILFFFTITSIFGLSLSAHAEGEIYMVAEAGSVSNKMAVSGDLAGIPTTSNSAGSFGITFGYRDITESNLLLGIEGFIATSSTSSNISDGLDTITFEENMISGIYLTGGMAFGEENKAKLYALLGVGAASGETSYEGIYSGSGSIDDKGEGISYGGAFEYSFTDNVGIRLKALHTRYKGEIDDLKIRDTSFTGGLVYSF